MDPRLTVVIVSYNREKYIRSAMESVLASDFQDFVVLVLDDASTDGTVDIAREIARGDRRVTVVVNDENLGQFENRNKAIELVDTPYLKYHDSDDLMYPHCLGIMMRLLEGEPAAGFAMTASRSWPGGPCPMLLSPRLAYLREYLGQGMFFGGPATGLFRTEVLRTLGGFPLKGVGSDYCFWLKACAKFHTLLVPADLFWYRTHPGQELVSARAARDYAVAQGEGWRALNDRECPLDGSELEEAKRRFTYRLMRLSWRDVRRGRFGPVHARLRSAGIRWRDWLRFPPARTIALDAGTPMADGD